MKSPATKDLEELNVLDATCGSDQFEQSCLRHTLLGEVFGDADHAGDLGANHVLEMQSCGDHI